MNNKLHLLILYITKEYVKDTTTGTIKNIENSIKGKDVKQHLISSLNNPKGVCIWNLQQLNIKS